MAAQLQKFHPVTYACNFKKTLTTTYERIRAKMDWKKQCYEKEMYLHGEP